MVFVKNWTFSHIFFWPKKNQKEAFFDIRDRKECFFDLKSEVLKKSKKSTFCKGVSAWFLSKNRPFSHLFFFFWAKKARKKDFLIFRIEKNAFQTTKDKFYKTLKNRHFAKGLVHGFCVKIDLFLIRIILSKKGRKKNFLIFWMENKAFWTLKVKFLQSRKKIEILQRG